MKTKVIVPVLSNDAALKTMEEMCQKLVRPETIAKFNYDPI